MECTGWACSHFYAALGRCLLFWCCHQPCHISRQRLPPRSFRCPLQLSTSPIAIFSLASFNVRGLKHCSAPAWSSSTRILLVQSPRTSLRSRTQQETTLSFSTEMKFKSHFISPHFSVFLSFKAHHICPLHPANFYALGFYQLLRENEYEMMQPALKRHQSLQVSKN